MSSESKEEEGVERAEALATLNVSMRRLMESVRTTRAPKGVIETARAQVEALSTELEPYIHPGPHAQADQLGGLGWVAETQDPMQIFPYSPLIGRLNPVSPPVEFWVEDGVVHGRGVFGALYCGPPGFVHGGVVAAVMDELLGVVNVVNDLGAMTGTLTVRYRKPTPLFQEIRMEGHSQGSEGRKVYAEGRFWAGEELLAEASGTFIKLTQAASDRFGWSG